VSYQIQSPNKKRQYNYYASRLIALENYKDHFQRGKSVFDLCFLKLPKEKEDWCFDDFYTEDGFQRYLLARNISPNQIQQRSDQLTEKYIEPIKSVGRKLAIGSTIAAVAAAFLIYKVLDS
jgi:hypothetical protein